MTVSSLGDGALVVMVQAGYRKPFRGLRLALCEDVRMRDRGNPFERSRDEDDGNGSAGRGRCQRVERLVNVDIRAIYAPIIIPILRIASLVPLYLTMAIIVGSRLISETCG